MRNSDCAAPSNWQRRRRLRQDSSRDGEIVQRQVVPCGSRGGVVRTVERLVVGEVACEAIQMDLDAYRVVAARDGVANRMVVN